MIGIFTVLTIATFIVIISISSANNDSNKRKCYYCKSVETPYNPLFKDSQGNLSCDKCLHKHLISGIGDLWGMTEEEAKRFYDSAQNGKL